MKLKLKTQAAMKVLIYLANQEDNISIDIHSLASEVEINYETARKIVKALSDINVIYCERGRKGGVYLAKPIEDVNIYDVIIKMEDVDMRFLNQQIEEGVDDIDYKFYQKTIMEERNFYLSYKNSFLNEFVDDDN